MGTEHWWKNIVSENTWRRNYSSATLSATKLTKTDMGLNTSLSSDRQATNRLNHGTTLQCKFHVKKKCEN